MKTTIAYKEKGVGIICFILVSMGVLGFAVGDGVSLGGGVSVASVTAYLQIVFNVLYLAIGGLKLASICIIDNKVYNNDGEVVSSGSIPASSSSVHPVKAETSSIKTAEPSVEMKDGDTLETKIKELKQLKEAGVIDEEQYSRALERLIKSQM